MTIPPLRDKKKKDKPKPFSSAEAILEKLTSSKLDLGALFIGIGEGINAFKEARRKRRNHEPLDADFPSPTRDHKEE